MPASCYVWVWWAQHGTLSNCFLYPLSISEVPATWSTSQSPDLPCGNDFRFPRPHAEQVATTELSYLEIQRCHEAFANSDGARPSVRPELCGSE